MTTKGYHGGIYDGRFVYFVPHADTWTHNHARVLRYDTQGPFTNVDSWVAYDAENTGGMTNGGYCGGVHDGRYIYFVPNSGISGYHGMALRYDTQGAFTNSGSWAAYDAGNTGGLNTKGYWGGVFDGRYVYFVPFRDSSSVHGKVLRYDTQGKFTNVTSWTAYDAGNTGGLDSKGFGGGVYDGQYVYFVPYWNTLSPHGIALRYDTQGAFTNSGSWMAYDAGNTDGLNTKGFVGCVL